jgi:hypothetical protein
MPDWAFHWTGYSLAAIAGLLLLLALFRDRARGQSRCRKCWYDLKEIGDLPITCPECGKAHTKPRHLQKTRRHKRLALVWLLVMVVGGYGLWVVPRVQDRGWVGAVPTTAMVAAAPWVNYRWTIPDAVRKDIRVDFQRRLSDGQPHWLSWVGGKYWSLAGTKVLWPMSTADLNNDYARNRDSVADIYFNKFLSRGYGSRADLIESVERGMFDGYGISLWGIPILDQNQEVIAVCIDHIFTGPGTDRFRIYMSAVPQSWKATERPAKLFTQTVIRGRGTSKRRENYNSESMLVACNTDGRFKTRVWIESEIGQSLGCYEIEWYEDHEVDEDRMFVAPSVYDWRRVSD